MDEPAADELFVIMQKFPDLLMRLQQASRDHDTSPERLKPLMNDTMDEMEKLLTWLEKNRATEPDNAAPLQSMLTNFSGLSDKLARNGLREEAARWGRLELRFSRPIVHANPHDVKVVLQHSDLVLRHVGLLCTNQMPAPVKAVLSTRLATSDRETAVLLVTEARQWLQGLSPQERERPEWQQRAQQLDAWQAVLLSANKIDEPSNR